MKLSSPLRFVATAFVVVVVACIAVAMPASAQCSYCWDAWCTKIGVNECPANHNGYYHLAEDPPPAPCPDDFTGEDPQWGSCYGEDFQRNFSHSYPAEDWCIAHLECHSPAPEAVANAVAARDALTLREWIQDEVIRLNTARQAIQIPDCVGTLIGHIPIDRRLLANLTGAS